MSAADPLADPAEIARRRAALARAHMAPLAALAREIRAARPGDAVPDADPRDGGARARALLLLEAPGPRSVSTGFVSCDTPNPTARNLRALLAGAGVARADVLLWNVVPWYVGDGRRVRPVTAREVDEAAPWLEALLDRLPALERAVLIGRKAQRAAPALAARRPDLEPILAFHPSPQVFHISPERRAATVAAFGELGRALAARQALARRDGS